jgi:cell division protein FtsL
MIHFHVRSKRIDNSRLVRSAAPERLREMLRLLGLGGLLAAGAFLYAWQHFQYIQLRYLQESLRAQHAQMREHNRQLSLEAAGLRAPARIDEIARQRLGLTAPAPGQLAPLEGSREPVLAGMRPAQALRAR